MASLVDASATWMSPSASTFCSRTGIGADALLVTLVCTGFDASFITITFWNAVAAHASGSRSTVHSVTQHQQERDEDCLTHIASPLPNMNGVRGRGRCSPRRTLRLSRSRASIQQITRVFASLPVTFSGQSIAVSEEMNLPGQAILFSCDIQPLEQSGFFRILLVGNYVPPRRTTFRGGRSTRQTRPAAAGLPSRCRRAPRPRRHERERRQASSREASLRPLCAQTPRKHPARPCGSSRANPHG